MFFAFLLSHKIRRIQAFMDTSNFTDKDFDNFFSSTKGTFFYKDLIYESLNTR